MQAALKPKHVRGWLVLQAIFLSSWAAEGLGELLWAGLNPAPETPLNVEIGPHRRYTIVRQELHKLGTIFLSRIAGSAPPWPRNCGMSADR